MVDGILLDLDLPAKTATLSCADLGRRTLRIVYAVLRATPRAVFLTIECTIDPPVHIEPRRRLELIEGGAA